MKNKLLLYDTFNAKYLSYQDISGSFVPNDEFLQLYANNNILLMGPRGCGKTTLLKMLTPAGLNFWQGEDAQIVKKSINFYAIYIPSDIQWKNQFEYLSFHLKGESELVKTIIGFLFAANCQIALCKTFRSIIELGDYTKKEFIELEYDICSSLVNTNTWNIEEDIPMTFDDVEIVILNRVRHINSIIKKHLLLKQIENIKYEIADYVYNGFFDLIQLGCKAFEKIIQMPETHKWALCFDELEIVPQFIQIELIKYLRSVDQKFIFKLTTTPLFNIGDEIIEASQGNDFSPIKLWVYDDAGLNRWEKFCKKLLSHRLKNKLGIEISDFESVFGRYNLDDIIKDELNSLNKQAKTKLLYNNRFYPGASRSSAVYYLFKRLAQPELDKDGSFKLFLKRRGIDANEPFSDDPTVQKSIFLKYKTELVYRLIYKDRTRRTPPIHYGIPHIFEICDGNPRLIIGLVDEILQASFDASDINNLKKGQTKIVFSASDRYFNLIKNHPDSTITVNNNKEINLASDILEKIGKYINGRITSDSFPVTTPTTFRIDEDINHKYVKLLENALALGAIIYLDPIESLSHSGIIGKRFRLSAFLTPKFKIPNRSNSEVNISTMLAPKTNKEEQTRFMY